MDIPLRGLRMAIIPCADLRDKAYPCHLGIGDGRYFTGGVPGSPDAAASEEGGNTDILLEEFGLWF